MKCPFCNSRLMVWKYDFHTTYGCDAACCVNDDMPRYQITYSNYPTALIARTIMLDKHYVQIDYQNDRTTVSVLEVCVLIDRVILPKALDINIKDMIGFSEKIRTLMVFS